MDAHLFRRFVGQISPLLLQGRIEKIQEPAKGHLNISFYGNGQKHNLYFRFGRQQPFCFLTSIRPQAMSKPSSAVMRLRKYFVNRRITAVVPQIWQRKLWLMATQPAGEKQHNSVWLCIDLVTGPGLHFLTHENVPLEEAASWPRPEELQAALSDWRSWPVLTPSLRKLLVGMDPKEGAALMADLELGGGDVFLYANPSGQIEKISAWPLPTQQMGSLKEAASDMILASFEKAGQDIVLHNLFMDQEKSVKLNEQRRQMKLAKTLEKLQEDEKRLSAMIAQGESARLLAENIWRFNKDDKKGQIELKGDKGIQNILLDRRFTILQNMERLFHTAKRGKRGLDMINKRRIQLLEEQHSHAPNSFPANQADSSGASANTKIQTIGKSKHFQTFLSSDGYRILRGRDARGNLLIRKMSSGHDLWVHVKEGPGAHVIIRRPHGNHMPPLSTLREAGMLAATKSWLNNSAEAEVMFAEVRHVKLPRNAPLGKVVLERIWNTLIVPLATPQEIELKDPSCG